MNKVVLKEINEGNFSDIIKLSDTLEDFQKRCVAPNVISLAQAYIYYDTAWPRAIYLDDIVIGFVMLSLDDSDIVEADQPAYYLWRFMIAKQFQAKGYGKKVLDLLIEKCREDNIEYLYTSCNMDTDQPYNFYINYGFVDTGEMDDDEEVLKIKVQKEQV